MQGQERIRKRWRDARSRMRTGLKAYDIRYRYTAPMTGFTKQVQGRFLRRADAEAFPRKINAEQTDGIHLAQKKVLVKYYTSLMLTSSVAIKKASEFLGHSSIAITADLYTQR